MQLVQHLSNGLYMLFAFTFDVDEDVIKVHYHENVELFYQDLVDVTQKYSQRVGQSKRHDLIFEVIIAGSKGRLPFIAFFNPYLMVGIG